MGACSSFTCSSADGRHFLGRTYDEYGTIEANRIAVIPRGHSVALTFTGDERQTTDYAVVGMDVAMFPTPLLTDGVNEHGLMGAMLYFPHYCKFDTRQADYDVNAGLLLPFVLGKAANLDEVEELLKHVNVIDEPSTGMTLPHHYIFSDPSGEAIVAEPLEGGLEVYRRTMGVLTNSPDYNWHLTNLNNYLGTSNWARPAQLVNGHEISEMGEGSGWFGLPGDYSPASRFVRLAFAKDCMPEPADETDAVTKMLNTFATVDVPMGIMYDPDEAAPHYEQTQCTIVMCAESKRYYFTSATNSRVCVVDLDEETSEGTTELKLIKPPLQQDILQLK